MTLETIPTTERTQQGPAIVATERTTCVVVGGGPAGAVLALLLARKGVPVTLLEEHKDFDRDFRGDTIHPSVLEIMEEIGLIDRLLELPHTKTYGVSVPVQISFQGLKTRYPYIMMVPQADFLEFITKEAAKYPAFRMVMGARAEALIEEDGLVRGVRYRAPDGVRELRAALTVGADGRFSRIRKLAGIEPIKTSQPIDIMWFRLPRKPTDTNELQARIDKGRIVVMLPRFDYWQCGYVIAKDTYSQVRAAGIGALRQALVDTVPDLADRVDLLQDWKQMSLLSVESSRVPRWHKPGLLLIGDAAHVMSPVGGVGINYAIQDAVEAANLLAEPLKTGRLTERDLAAVQRRRELPMRVIQWFQTSMQQRIMVPALSDNKPFQMPPLVRAVLGLPFVRLALARLMGFGLRTAHAR